MNGLAFGSAELASLVSPEDERGENNGAGARARAAETEAASVKRFVERYLGDKGFRDALHEVAHRPEDLRSILDAYELRLDPGDAWAYLQRNAPGGVPVDSPALRSYREIAGEVARSAYSINARADRSPRRRYALWRQRQLGALRFQCSSAADLIVHPVAAYELSRGCSVGCWFCAVGAEKLQGHFLATEKNLELFRQVQACMRQALGEAAGAAMCYWATDALDNPDYERFAAAFHAEHGVFPPTTTAIGWKDPDRTRALLRASAAAGTLANRFSVLSVGMLNRLHALFSADELLHTGLVFQMPDALVPIDLLSNAPARKIRAGRARTLSSDDRRVYDEDAGTVACVVGFLINFVKRTIRLVAPTLPSDAWPLGYRTLAETNDFTRENFASVLEQMISEKMPTGFPDEPLQLSDLLDADISPQGLCVRNAKYAVTLPSRGMPASSLECLVELLRAGTQSAANISFALRSRGVSLLQSQTLLHSLRAEGVFEIA